MGFRINQENDVTLIDVSGRLIVTNRQDFRERVIEQIASGARNFVIDFTNTTFIDSSGLGVLVTVWKAIEGKKGRLHLAGLNEDLRLLFSLTKLDTVFQICESCEEAMRRMKVVMEGSPAPAE